VLAGLSRVHPRTVVWLNEAQLYLDTPGDNGERVAAGLRELLRDPRRRPVLVLATLWPEHWDTLTARTDPDRHAQARELLSGRTIHVPNSFAGDDDALKALRELAGTDPRLAEAEEHAADGQVTQYLAGVPVLMERYAQAPPAARELIHAAMDVRRFGCGIDLPIAFLADAASTCLTTAEWRRVGDNWLEKALSYATRQSDGVPGLLILSRPRASDDLRRTRHPVRPFYQLADYLDQVGRRDRRELIPSPGFWAAAEASLPDELSTLAKAAHEHGLLRISAGFYKHAGTGDPWAANMLLQILYSNERSDGRPARWAAANAPVDDPRGAVQLLRVIHAIGFDENLAVLADRIAEQVRLDDRNAVTELLWALNLPGLRSQQMVLARRVAAEIPIDNPRAVRFMLDTLLGVLALDSATALADRAAAHAPLDDCYNVSYLLMALRESHAHIQIGVVLARLVMARIPLGADDGVAALLWELLRVPAYDELKLLAEQVSRHIFAYSADEVINILRAIWSAGIDEAVVLTDQIVADSSFTTPRFVADLLEILREAGADKQARFVLSHDPATQVSLADTDAVIRLLWALRETGAEDQRTALARRIVGHVSLDLPGAVAFLLWTLREMGDERERSALADRIAARAPLDDPYKVAQLLKALIDNEAVQQADVLLSRDPAMKVSVRDTKNVIVLLLMLREAGASSQIHALATRVISEVGLDNPDLVADLLRILQEVSADDQARMLAARVAADAPVDNCYSVAVLIKALMKSGAQAELRVLLDRDPATIATIENLDRVASLIYVLRHAGAEAQLSVLLKRCEEIRSRNDPAYAVGSLLRALWDVGADAQAATLADQVVTHVPLQSPDSVVTLLSVLRENGAEENALRLTARLSAAGMFDLFLAQRDNRRLYKYGSDENGLPASHWGWDDLH
jgi:hypothetical protein